MLAHSEQTLKKHAQRFLPHISQHTQKRELHSEMPVLQRADWNWTRPSAGHTCELD